MNNLSKAFKLCFNNEIHRLSKVPDNYESLAQSFKLTFKNKLPTRWALQYDDEEGDRIMLTNQGDFEAMLELESQTSTKAIKIYVLPLDDTKMNSSVMVASIKPEGLSENKSGELKISEKKVFKYSVRLNKIVSSIPAKFTIKNDTLYLTVSLTNSGAESWPKNCMIQHVSGIQGSDVKAVDLAPGKEFSCIMLLKNPGTAGEHISTWSLACPDEDGKIQRISESFDLTLNIADVIQVQNEKTEVETNKELIVKNDDDRVIQKAKYIKEMFPHVNYDEVLDFIRAVPLISVQELAENYLH